jgi:hypothetical protein
MYTTILVYILGFLVIALLIWIFIIEHRLKKFFLGRNASSLEDILLEINKQNKNLEETQKAINSHLEKVDTKLGSTIRNIKTLRFNPFEDQGSKQSFAVSLLNDNGDGVILSSLFARDRMSIFAKPIQNGASEFELTDEEKEVLTQSK